MNDINKIVDFLKLVNVESNDAKRYIHSLFLQYKKSLKNNQISENDSNILEIILCCFFMYCEVPDMNEVFNTFRRKYIYNENEVEVVHRLSERSGLGVAYDYIAELEDYSHVDLMTLIPIHRKIYSKTSNKSFGGEIRNITVYIKDNPADLCPPEYIIPSLMKELPVSKNLALKAVEIHDSKDPKEKLAFINECLEMKCKLLKIHPFLDGNGRSIRILINLYFKMAGIPPIYVHASEKDEYLKAVIMATKPDEERPSMSEIQRFYYYKICDSMFALDLLNTKISEKSAQR